MALNKDTGGIRPALDEQSGNLGAVGSTARDRDGWIIPGPRRVPPQRQPEAEAANQKRLVDQLKRCGWHIAEQAACYTRDGEARYPDILIWHQDLKSVGAVEVKSKIVDRRSAIDAFKQCIDYTQCKVLATGHRVEWGGIFPFDPATAGERIGSEMWGAAGLAALNFKVCTFLDEPAFRRWDALLKKLDAALVRTPDRIRLQYTDENRVWCTENGFVANAVGMLTGKRKVGGARRHA